MTAILAEALPYLVLGGLLLTAGIWLVRMAIKRGEDSEKRKQAEGDDAADKRVEGQRADPRTVDDVGNWLRHADANESDPRP